MKLWREQYRAKLPPHQRYHVEYLTANRDELEVAVSEQKALNETLCQDVVLTPLNDSQNIPPPLEQSPPQINSAPPPIEIEQPPLLNIPPSSGDQMTDPPVTHRASSPEIIDANKLTMQQALELLFELLLARKSKEVDKAVTVEAEPVARAPARAEPLFYLTHWDNRRDYWEQESSCASRTYVYLGRKGGKVHASEPLLLFGQHHFWREVLHGR
jgi:hypothetical protein